MSTADYVAWKKWSDDTIAWRECVVEIP
jgi:hypothetical protein